MKKGINTFIKVYMEILYALSSVFYAGFCLCVLVQVISRNFLPNAPSWTEELARYSFIYMVAFGVGLAALKHEFVNVEFLGDFPQGPQSESTGCAESGHRGHHSGHVPDHSGDG